MNAKNVNSFGNALIKKLIAEIVLERGVVRSMRGERRGFLLDRGLLGHGRGGGRGLALPTSGGDHRPSLGRKVGISR